jgi:hypothetical protein
MTLVSHATDRPNQPREGLRFEADRRHTRPLAQRLAALLAHQDGLLSAAQAAVRGRERELEMARLELRAAEYARALLEHWLETVLHAIVRESPKRREERLARRRTPTAP